jgi:tetratricopeptide (TPR) repeat protein
VPDAPELCLAEVCLQQGRLDDAEPHFQHVLQHDPNNARAQLGLGRLACERGNLTGSLEHLKRAATDKRTQKASAVLLAQVYHQLGDTAAANRERQRAADLPDDTAWPDPFVEETRSLTTGKQYRLAHLKALNQQGRAAELRPFAQKLETDYPDVYWLVEGRQQMDKKNWKAAEQALRLAVQLAPDSIYPHFELGTVLFQQQNYHAAAECFRKVIELEPDYAPAHQCLGRCWLRQGNRAEAIRAFQAAVSCMPQDAEAHRELGRLLLENGQLAEGQVQLRQALQLRPGDAKAKELLDEVSKRAP